jgi:alkyl sulfatase BDS1-like metallo-beta-lactamase superfamily hydrolase
VVRELRAITDLPVRYVIYTHGHYDHAFGTPALLDDASARGHAAPDVVGHVNVARRFERYAKTAGHLAHTFDLQFASWGASGGDVVRKARYCPPTIEYDDRIVLDGLGGRLLDLRHGLGETDDHTWVWVPDARVIVGGDFIVSSLPNAGTPFRVQRFVLEWAEALEEMATVEPAAIVSGHGDVFTDDAAEMLLTTSRALRWLDAEVVRRINDGQWQEQILAEVELPEDLAASEYLQPLYGCTVFAVRDLLRRYMGWYDGNPSMLFPSTRAEVAREVVALTGTTRLLERADDLAAGDAEAHQRALHLVDFVIFAGGGDVPEARRRKAELLEARARGERSFVAGNVLASAAKLERDRIVGA